ncbi:citrate-proton symporter [Salmonella enterica subsp. enterica]|uniref:Citrate-proton symporter n=1 Tax=Salmonella enterica I TaxID=59201 RepID=A0A379WC82_SALET|nr:citrate-proton symporter [Salmonella enterica subsp. enterica]
MLGAYIDRIGRRKGLMVTLALWAAVRCSSPRPRLPNDRLAAPALVLLAGYYKDFLRGVELGGVSVYLSEIATPGNKGFYTSWQSASQQVAIVVAALIGYSLNITLGTRRDIGVGLANSVLYRLYDHSADFCFTSFITRNRGVLQRKHRPTPGKFLQLSPKTGALLRPERCWWR